MWVRIPLETYIFILNFSLPPRSEQVNGANANEIKHVNSPEVIVVLDPRYDLSYKALYISTCSIALKFHRSRCIDSDRLKLRCTNKYIEFPSENRVLARCMSRLISFAISLSCYAARETSENFKMKNSCPWWESISGPLTRQTDALSIAPRGRLNVDIYRRTISILISIYIAPRADVDRWNQIYCFIMYRNVIQYKTFLLLSIVDYVLSRTHCNTRENTFESVSDDDKER